MTTYDAIKHYGTQQKLADALGIAQSTVSEWGAYPPGFRQLQIQHLTRARLRAEPDVFSKRRRAA
jgi:DNA-binding transcriptional regulator YdaS (Cro superfamily)